MLKGLYICDMKNQYNAEDYKVGYWEKYHYSGKIFYKGNYIDGKREGYWEFYYPNGTLDYAGKFVNDIRVGLWKYYFDGELTYKEYFI